MELFSGKETQSKSLSKKGKRHTCISCGLYKSAIHPKINVSGKGKKGILILGTSPSDAEDRKGQLWIGSDVRLLGKTLKDLGVSLERDCWTLAAVRCRTTKEKEYRNPVMSEILSCRNLVLNSIEELKPKVIILMGLTAVNSVIGHTTGEGYDSLDKWRGAKIPDRILNTFLCPMNHPREIENHKGDAIRTIWKNDLKEALKLADKEFPAHPGTINNVKIIDKEKEINSVLKKAAKAGLFAWDIEATGLKPHRTDVHKIVCLSICFDPKISYCFPCLDLRKSTLKLMRKIFEDPKIKKVAQNMKYEHTWFKNILGIEVKGWQHDTMQASHILNNRSGVTGLKFQTYLNFGVHGYEDSSQKYIKAEHSNDVNRVIEAMNQPTTKKDLMIYCGLDSLYTLLLYYVQKPQIKKRKPAYNLMHNGILALARAEQKGMRVDVRYLKQQNRKLTKQIEEKSEALNASKLIRQWKHIYGSTFNLGSGKQLGRMLYTERKLKPPKLTKSGLGSVDDDALKQLNLPELNKLLEIRKLEKAKGTYIEGFLREQVNGIIHPFFNLHIATTYRSSSNAPNFQNVSKRDKEMKKLIRTSIIPSEGNQLMEADFSKLEVSIAACYHKDPKMLDYLTSDKNDMHGDLAEQIFKIKDFDKHVSEHATLRSAAKNGFVFPQFYGDYYANNAIDLCQWIELPRDKKWKIGQGMKMPNQSFISNHMIKQGISTPDKFANHLKDIEYDFWNNRFAAYARWKDKWMAAYEKKGSFDGLTGFSYVGVMSRNDAINYPVQGAAFHCLLWCFIEVDRISKEENWKTRLIGQIHDALVLDVDPAEIDHVAKVVHRVCTVDLLKAFKWINVPLQIEIEVSKIDGNWADMEELELSVE